jgi:hypothetical protein
MRNSPLTAFQNVDIAVASSHLGSVTAHSEFIDTSVLSPVAAESDIAWEDDTLRLLEEEAIEVVLDKCSSISGSIRNSGEEDSSISISGSDSLWVKSGQGIVPEGEKAANLSLSDGRARCSSVLSLSESHEGGCDQKDGLVHLNLTVCGMSKYWKLFNSNLNYKMMHNTSYLITSV